MRAAWFWARIEMRRRRRATIALAVLAGIGGGIVMSTLAAARRTDTAYPRLVSELAGADLVVANFAGSESVAPEAVEGIAGLQALEAIRFAALKVGDEFVAAWARSVPVTRAGVDRVKIVRGRAPDPDRPGELLATLLGEEHGLRVGQRFPLATFPGEENGFDEFAAAIAARPLSMVVVGVAAAPGLFPPSVSEVAPMAFLTPAFHRSYPNAFAGTPDSSLVKLAPGTDPEEFRAAIARASGGALVSLLDRRAQDANTQRPFHLQAVALWLLGGMTALLVALVLAQAVVRHASHESPDLRALAALGMRPAEQAAGSALSLVPAALAAALIACAVTVLTSAWTPVGLARVAEPSPGIVIDATMLGGGSVALAALFASSAASATFAAIRRSRRSGAERVRGLANAAARLSLPPAVRAGLGFALDPGRGSTAVPVRTAVAGVAVAVTSLIATLTFAASLANLLGQPRLYGVTWDITLGADAIGGFNEEVAARLAEVPGVGAVSIGNLALDMLVNGRPVEGLAFEGSLDPTIISGRAPRGEEEVALGPRTLNRLAVRVGDRVTISPEGSRIELDMRVVGSALIAGGRESTRIGDGALISAAAFLKIGRMLEIPDFAAGNAFLQLEPGASAEQVRSAVTQLLAPGTKFGESVYAQPLATPSDVVSFGRVRNLPFVLAAALGIFASATLAHTLLTAIRRRRHAIAVLKTLGFSRRQVATSISVQGASMTAIALEIALPLGVVAGRWSWSALAQDLGVIDVSVVPLVAVFATIPSALVLALAMAAAPAVTAARTTAAAVLRTE